MELPSLEDRLYSAPEVARLVGVTYRQINYWVTKGYLMPTDGLTERGPGNAAEFTPVEVMVAFWLAHLVREAGMLPSFARPIAVGLATEHTYTSGVMTYTVTARKRETA